MELQLYLYHVRIEPILITSTPPHDPSLLLEYFKLADAIEDLTSRLRPMLALLEAAYVDIVGVVAYHISFVHDDGIYWTGRTPLYIRVAND